VPKEKLFAQARDELFSHINRCGVLNATDDDMTVWMGETIDYIGERYPDLVDPDLRELHEVGMRFCQPAINNVAVQHEVIEVPDGTSEEVGTSQEMIAEEAVSEDSSASGSPATLTIGDVAKEDSETSSA
tara:strand:+ start:497 stop:886 length:390 start_codon:yes stop_codon:yes gene_type:complete